MIALDHYSAFVSGRAASRAATAAAMRFTRMIRAISISWRIGSFAVINFVVVVVLAGMIWNGTRMLGAAWDDMRRLRESETLLMQLATEAGRLQSLIYQYIGEQRPETFTEILLCEAVLGTLTAQGSHDPLLSDAVPELTGHTERFIGAFGYLRVLQSAVTRVHRDAVGRPGVPRRRGGIKGREEDEPDEIARGVVRSRGEIHALAAAHARARAGVRRP